MTTPPTDDRGLTDPLDPYVPDSLQPVLDLVDGRAGIAVDDQGIEVRGLIRTRRVAWDDVSAVQLDNRLDVLLGAGARFVPVGRVPVVGGLLVDGLRRVASAASRRLTPGVRERAGWGVATLVREGMRRDVDIEGGAALTALLSPSLVDSLVAHAEARGIPVERA